VEVREEGAAAPVPISLESPAAAGWFLTNWNVNYTGQRMIKLSRALREGTVTLSFLDDCGGMTNGTLVPPVRDEHIRFTVGPAVPFPTRTGTARVTAVEFVERSHCRQRRIWVEIDLPPDLAAFPLLGMSAGAEGRHFPQGFWRPRQDLIQGNLFAACGPGPLEGALSPGRHTIEFSAKIGGGPTLPPLLMTLDVDCGADAGVCEDPLAPDPLATDAAALPPDAAVATPDATLAEPDVAASLPDAAVLEPDAAVLEPDAAVEPDAAPSAPDASGGSAASRAPGAASGVAVGANHGCDCATGGAPRGAPVLGLALALAWCARRFTARRQRARASGGPPRPRRP
jgi:hypothetical protein